MEPTELTEPATDNPRAARRARWIAAMGAFVFVAGGLSMIAFRVFSFIPTSGESYGWSLGFDLATLEMLGATLVGLARVCVTGLLIVAVAKLLLYMTGVEKPGWLLRNANRCVILLAVLWMVKGASGLLWMYIRYTSAGSPRMSGFMQWLLAYGWPMLSAFGVACMFLALGMLFKRVLRMADESQSAAEPTEASGDGAWVARCVPWVTGLGILVAVIVGMSEGAMIAGVLIVIFLALGLAVRRVWRMIDESKKLAEPARSDLWVTRLAPWITALGIAIVVGGALYTGMTFAYMVTLAMDRDPSVGGNVGMGAVWMVVELARVCVTGLLVIAMAKLLSYMTGHEKPGWFLRNMNSGLLLLAILWMLKGAFSLAGTCMFFASADRYFPEGTPWHVWLQQGLTGGWMFLSPFVIAFTLLAIGMAVKRVLTSCPPSRDHKTSL